MLKTSGNPKSEIRNPKSAESGFSLLELMIVLFIIVILATVALPQYQNTVRHARETVLKDNITQMRRMIEQYSADKGKCPENLQKLVQDRYLGEIPVDPISETREWNEIPASADDACASDNGAGIISVKSMAEGEFMNGTPYSDY